MKKWILLAWLWLSLLPLHAQDTGNNGYKGESVFMADSSLSVVGWLGYLQDKGLVLSMNAANVDLQETIAFYGERLSVSSLLERLFHRYEYEYSCKWPGKVLLKIKRLRTVHYSGAVSDAETGERLYAYAVIFTNRQGRRFLSLSNESGLFSLDLLPDAYTIKVTYLGYEDYTANIPVTQSGFVQVKLRPLPISLAQLLVQPRPDPLDINGQGPAAFASMHSSDPCSGVNSLPGVIGAAVAGNLHVNGGYRDENQLLLDGFELLHAGHNNSLLPQFNGDAIQNVSFYGSFIPAQYEGRLSSVTDMRVKAGHAREHRQSLALDMPAAGATFEGPLAEGKLSYLLALRHSWLDFAEQVFADKAGARRSFSDVLGKLNWNLRPGTTLQALYYRSGDRHYDDAVSRGRSILRWHSNLYAFTCDALIAHKIIHTTKLSYTDYANSILAPAIGIDIDKYLQEKIGRWSVNSDFNLRLDHILQLTWGVKAELDRFSLLGATEEVTQNNHLTLSLSLYGNARMKLSNRLMADAALNVLAYLPKGSSSRLSLQPRFSLRYFPHPRHSLFLDFSRMEQFYHYICLSQTPMPTDFRMPSLNGFEPSSSMHVEGGWKFRQSQWSAHLSGYWKRRFKILGVRYDQLPDAPGWKRFIMTGDAHSYGLKCAVSAHGRRWMGHLSYTYSRSMEWFTEYDGGTVHPSFHDIPHSLTVNAAVKVAKDLFVGMGGYVKSGRFEQLFINDPSGLAFMRRQPRQGPNYRLDLNFSGSSGFRRSRLVMGYKAGLYNIVGNPLPEEILDLYSVRISRHCLPYASLHLKF